MLGGVDGFDEDEAEGEGNKGAIVLGGLLAAERHALEALKLSHKLLNAGPEPDRVAPFGPAAETWACTTVGQCGSASGGSAKPVCSRP